jgi:hypothetical protein
MKVVNKSYTGTYHLLAKYGIKANNGMVVVDKCLKDAILTETGTNINTLLRRYNEKSNISASEFVRRMQQKV